MWIHDPVHRRSSRTLMGLGFLAWLMVSGCATRRPDAQSPGSFADTPSASALRPHAKAGTTAERTRPAADDGSVTRTAVASARPPGSDDSSADIPPSIPLNSPLYPIDLFAALRLADSENPTIAEARVGILAALAQQQVARALLFPSLNAGGNYHYHDGNLQRSSGRILKLSEQSLYLGGGARSLAAETVAIPAVNLFSPLTDAIYEPLVARQRLDGARLNAQATANSVLLEVTKLFFDLLGAESTLEAQRLSASQADEIVRIVSAYAATGQGLKSDADRAEADRRMLQGAIQNAEEEVAVASVRLSRRLNLDPSIRLSTVSGPLVPLYLIEPSTPVSELLQTALSRRPDLGFRSAAVRQAEYQLREEKARPLLPTLWLGFSGAGFGGGSNLIPPTLGHFGGRTDFDLRAYWTLLNFGVGNAALIKGRQAGVGQAEAERARVLNLIRSEVVSSRADSLSQRGQIEVDRAELVSAEEGYREDYFRLKQTVGLPIEVLDSLKRLARARLTLIEAITRSNQAQFALFVSLGSPPPLDPAAPGFASPPPIATPLRSPIVSKGTREPTPFVAQPVAPTLGR